MKRLVLKFGGTSMASMPQIKRVAQKIAHEYQTHKEICVVVSAMAGVTDDLVHLCAEASLLHDLKEYDSIVSTGEQVSAALLAMCLQQLGLMSRSWLGWQVPIITNEHHGSAHIQKIETTQLEEAFQEQEIAIISGFQGVSKKGRITTLGRGGSDVSAVALAAALGADRCDIYTDVDGVYTADPRIVPQAQKINQISLSEMRMLAYMGAKVLHPRSVDLADRHSVSVQVLSTFSDKIGSEMPGTLVIPDDQSASLSRISGVAQLRSLHVLRLNLKPTDNSLLETFFEMLRQNHVFIVSLNERVIHGELSVTIGFLSKDLPKVEKILQTLKRDIGLKTYEILLSYAKVSIIGMHLGRKSEYIERFINLFHEKAIPYLYFSLSDQNLTALIPEDYVELVVRSLHQGFELDKSINETSLLLQDEQKWMCNKN